MTKGHFAFISFVIAPSANSALVSAMAIWVDQVVQLMEEYWLSSKQWIYWQTYDGR
jgi:hypothetical protein